MAKKVGKVAISCAITGAIHTPTMSDALPYKPTISLATIDAAAAEPVLIFTLGIQWMVLYLDPEHSLGSSRLSALTRMLC